MHTQFLAICEHKVASKNVHIGEFQLINLPPGKAGTVKTDVSFEISSEGLTTVWAVLVGGGDNSQNKQTQSLTIKQTKGMGMTAEELEAAVAEADAPGRTKANRDQAKKRQEVMKRCQALKCKLNNDNPSNLLEPAMKKQLKDQLIGSSTRKKTPKTFEMRLNQRLSRSRWSKSKRIVRTSAAATSSRAGLWIEEQLVRQLDGYLSTVGRQF